MMRRISAAKFTPSTGRKRGGAWRAGKHQLGPGPLAPLCITPFGVTLISVMTSIENPFVCGEIVDDANFVNRTSEIKQLVRDLADGQKVFLLSPRRFGKSSLVALALLKLKKRHIHTVSLTVSSYSSYT